MKSQANCCLVEKAWTCRFIPLLVLFVHSFTVFQRYTHSLGLVLKYFLKNALHSLTLTHLHRHLRFQQTRRFHVIYISFRSVVCARVFFPAPNGWAVPVCMLSNDNNDCQSFSRPMPQTAQAQNLFIIELFICRWSYLEYVSCICDFFFLSLFFRIFRMRLLRYLSLVHRVYNR